MLHGEVFDIKNMAKVVKKVLTIEQKFIRLIVLLFIIAIYKFVLIPPATEWATEWIETHYNTPGREMYIEPWQTNSLIGFNGESLVVNPPRTEEADANTPEPPERHPSAFFSTKVPVQKGTISARQFAKGGTNQAQRNESSSDVLTQKWRILFILDSDITQRVVTPEQAIAHLDKALTIFVEKNHKEISKRNTFTDPLNQKMVGRAQELWDKILQEEYLPKLTWKQFLKDNRIISTEIIFGRPEGH